MTVTTEQQERVQRLYNDVLDKAKGFIPYNENVSKQIDYFKSIRTYGKCRNKSKILLNEYIMECTDKEILSVLWHELIHTCPDTHGHDYMFKIYCNRLLSKYDIYTNTTDNLQNAKTMKQKRQEHRANRVKKEHAFVCQHCGKVFHRYRYMDTSRYTCRCGGHLTYKGYRVIE